MMAAAKASVDRAVAGAEAVRNAAAAIGVIYTAALGVAFSVSKPLPLRGTIPALFLGIAIVMATAYQSFPFRQKSARSFPQEAGPPLADQQKYAATFITWIADRVDHKKYTLRASILSLAFGVVFLPVGFVSLGVSSSRAGDLEPWPSPPTQVTEQTQAEVLYRAQVAEVASQREVKLHVSPTESLHVRGVAAVYGAAFLAVLVVFLLPLAFAAREKRHEPSAKKHAPESLRT
jgi:hypothetical protein